MALRVAIAGFGRVGQRRFNFLNKKKIFSRLYRSVINFLSIEENLELELYIQTIK